MPMKLRATWNLRRSNLALLSTFLFIFALASPALADPCVVNDPSGTITLPPMGCEYLTGTDAFEIVSGLPPGTTIELVPIQKDFICNERALQPSCSVPIIPGLSCEQPGGNFPGGHQNCIDSSLELAVTGTGVLAGFSRTIFVGAPTVVDTAPRTPGDAVQSFDTEMVSLEAQLFGDPDFCVINIRAGSFFGLPSPGHTTLTNIGGDDWSVDSFFDITYQIDFQGCPGSVLEGFGGTSQGLLRIQAGDPIVVENVPGISGPWLFVFVTALAGSAFFLVRRRPAA
jgi:hypothetical protein